MLAQDETHAILGRWSIESDSAELLYALGQAVRRDPSVSKQLSPLSHAKPASSFYRGKIERFYLAALLVARLPIIEEDPRHWYVTLSASDVGAIASHSMADKKLVDFILPPAY